MESKLVICDTDVLIDYFEKRKTRHEKTVDIIENKIGLDNVLISIISLMELTIGASNKNDLHLLNSQLNNFDIVPINTDISITASQLLNNFHLSHRIGIADCLIAASSVKLRVPLFTYNIKDFKFINNVELMKF